MALEFIIGIDELLYGAAFPESATQELGIMKFAHPAKKVTDDIVGAYHRSLSFLFMGCLWVVIYVAFLQQVIPGYNFDLNAVCAEYYEDHFRLLCHPWQHYNEKDCFPAGR